MNKKMKAVCALLGKVVMVFSLVMLVPFFYGICINEWIWPLFFSAVITLVLGVLIDRNGQKSTSITLSQGFVLVSFTWILASLVGALPYYMWNELPSFIDALFESVSGYTATGATVILNVDGMPRPLLLYRSMTHWFGGMGIIILLLAFLRSLGAEAANLFNAEAAINGYGQIMPRIRKYAITLWGMYCLFSAVLFGLLCLAGMPIFEALNYAMSIIATGGFAARSAGVFIYEENYAIQAIFILFMILSGGNYGLYYLGWKKGFRLIFKDTEFRTYISILCVGALVIAGTLFFKQNTTILESLMDGFFTMTSIQTGSGFAVADYGLWSPFAKTILFIAMFIGGCSGSTTGSVKVIRYIYIGKAIWAYLQQMIHPGMVKVVKYNGEAVPNKKVMVTLIFFILYILILFASTLLVTLTGMPIMESLAGVASTLGNVGVAFGQLGPTGSYALAHPWAKVVFIVDMLLGRLELLTLLVMLHPGFWSNFLRKDKRRLQKEKRQRYL